MNEIAILGTVVTALWGLTLGLIAVVWGMLREQNRQQGVALEKLQAQNTEQETSLGRLFERMKAREEAHAQHREDVSSRLDRIEGLLHQLLRGGGRGPSSPYPGSYSSTERKERT